MMLPFIHAIMLQLPSWHSPHGFWSAQGIEQMLSQVALTVSTLPFAMCMRSAFAIVGAAALCRYSMFAVREILFHGVYTWIPSGAVWDTANAFQWWLYRNVVSTDVRCRDIVVAYLPSGDNYFIGVIKTALVGSSIPIAFGLASLFLAQTCYDVDRRCSPLFLFCMRIHRATQWCIRMPTPLAWAVGAITVGYGWVILERLAPALGWFLPATTATFIVGSFGLLVAALVVACIIERFSLVATTCFSLRLLVNAIDVAGELCSLRTACFLRFGFDFIRKLVALECALSGATASYFEVVGNFRLQFVRCSLALLISALYASFGLLISKTCRQPAASVDDTEKRGSGSDSPI